MKSNNMMEINNKIEILTEKHERARSIIQEVIDEETFSIAVPVLNGLNYVLSNNQEIDCAYNDGKGNVYKFHGKVTGRKVERIPLIIITRSTELKKIQRRDFVRIPILNDIKYTTEINENSYATKDLDKCDFKTGKSIDLSGGGMKIQISEKLNVGKAILIKTFIGSHLILSICEVVRVDKISDKQYTYAVKFKYIDSKSREEVIKYIFENMRKSINTR